MDMRPYVLRGTKAATVAAVATLVGWNVFDRLNARAGHSADAVGLLFLPLAVWAGLRLIRVKGNHLAVVVSGPLWLTLTAPHLVDTRPGPGTVIWWVAVQATTTGAAMAVQNLPIATALR